MTAEAAPPSDEELASDGGAEFPRAADASGTADALWSSLTPAGAATLCWRRALAVEQLLRNLETATDDPRAESDRRHVVTQTVRHLFHFALAIRSPGTAVRALEALLCLQRY